MVKSKRITGCSLEKARLQAQRYANESGMVFAIWKLEDESYCYSQIDHSDGVDETIFPADRFDLLTEYLDSVGAIRQMSYKELVSENLELSIRMYKIGHHMLFIKREVEFRNQDQQLVAIPIWRAYGDISESLAAANVIADIRKHCRT